eukprot:GILK01002453.1.p1 GENE.GILK01002453.1~~GILK01002453.1.p1  ORF type:complete len:201 (-),score=30.14 GILK01002453.1:270-872(-)
MKFKFCGDLDAPDWILAEMAVLSRISSIRMKLLCSQVLNHSITGEMDYAKVTKLASDSGLDASEVKAAIAAIHFINMNAAKFNVDEGTLVKELQQLGLPKENSEALARPYRDKKQSLRQQLAATSLRLPQLLSMDWRVDCILSTSDIQEAYAPSVRMQLHLNRSCESNQPHTVALELSDSQFQLLLNELKVARDAMNQFE